MMAAPMKGGQLVNNLSVKVRDWPLTVLAPSGVAPALSQGLTKGR